MKALENNHETQWALEEPESLRCPEPAEATIPKISYFQHMYKEKNGDMTSLGGVNSSLCFRKHPSGNFTIHTTAIITFHLGLFTMC